MKPLGDGFIKLVKMIIAPVIFITLTLGIAHMTDLKKVGRIAIKAMLYFFTFSTLALIIGLIIILIPLSIKANPLPVSSRTEERLSVPT